MKHILELYVVSCALASVAHLIGHSPTKRKVKQGTYLGCGFSPQLGRV